MKLDASIFRVSDRQVDWLACLFIFIFSYLILSSAGDDFSYDYINYINYLNRLNDFTTQDIVDSIQASFPYIQIPPTGFFEIGFSFLAWSLLSSGFESSTTYALIGSTSIAIRALLLRKIGINWSLLALVLLYSITLFEANAIRLGCAITILIGAIIAIKENRTTSSVFLMAAAAFFHVQTLVLTIPIIFSIYCERAKPGSSLLPKALVFIYALGSITFALTIQQITSLKISDYIGTSSLATGLNIVSIISILFVTIGTFLILKKNNMSHDKQSIETIKVWRSVLVSTYPSLALLLLGTNLGAIGDRLWQAALVCLVATIPLLKELNSFAMAYKLTLIFCLAFSVYSVTVRYPLSNFFAPIIPHTKIEPLFLVF